MSERTIRHEAGHIGAWIMAGRLPEEVRVDRPEYGLAGVMRPTWDQLDPALARDLALCVLAGPLAEPRAGWPPEWPLDEEAATGDAALLALLARYLQLDEDGWRSLCEAAQTVVESPEFKHLAALIASALERVPVLDADQLRRLLGPDLLAKYLEPAGEKSVCPPSISSTEQEKP